MERTRSRPLPSGLVRPNHALAFGAVIGLTGTAILGGLVNRAAATLAVIALAYYVLPYTAWLKRRTYWSAIIGSAIGAIPPLIGWVAVTHRLELTPALLSSIVILWTLPHFWALGIVRREDYARAGLTILPEKGIAAWIVASSLLLVATSILLVGVADLGGFYVVATCILNAGFVYLALRMACGGSLQTARRLYGYSIIYIAALFGAMILDRVATSPVTV
jgi:protoheme IX farnesyltransferase